MMSEKRFYAKYLWTPIGMVAIANVFNWEGVPYRKKESIFVPEPLIWRGGYTVAVALKRPNYNCTPTYAVRVRLSGLDKLIHWLPSVSGGVSSPAIY